MIWNRYRTGDYLIAIVSQTVYLIATLKVAEKVPTVFDGDTPLDKAARMGLRDYDYGDAQLLDERMFRDYGVKAPELMRLAKAKYWQTVVRYPGAYIITMWERLRYRQQASMLGDVLMRLDDLDWWRFVGPQKPYMTGWRLDIAKFIETRDLRYLTASAIAQGVPRAIFRAVTLVLFALFTFTLPVLVLRDLVHRVNQRRATLLGSLFVLYWGVLFIYMLVGVEIRYLGPICSIPILGALWVCVQVAQRLQNARKIASKPL